MSLIIKGVDMPKSGESMTYSSKEIIEIPTPHGRLVDADALKEKIESIYGGALWTFDCFTLIDDEEIVPTIIEAEVSE